MHVLGEHADPRIFMASVAVVSCLRLCWESFPRDGRKRHEWDSVLAAGAGIARALEHAASVRRAGKYTAETRLVPTAATLSPGPNHYPLWDDKEYTARMRTFRRRS